jgi:hypothetical protein
MPGSDVEELRQLLRPWHARGATVPQLGAMCPELEHTVKEELYLHIVQNILPVQMLLNSSPR